MNALCELNVQVCEGDDCIYRFIGTYDYVFIVDTDDFFVPRVPGELTIHYYIKNWCQGAGTCQLSWVRYYPDCGLGTTGEDGAEGGLQGHHWFNIWLV